MTTPSLHLQLDATDRLLAPLVRERFDAELRKRIDAEMQHQLAIFLSTREPRRVLAAAA